MEASGSSEKLFGAVCKNFRQLQIILTTYNELFAVHILSIFIFVTASMEVCCLYGTIQALQAGTLFQSSHGLILAFSVVASIFNLFFVLGILADIHMVSEDVHKRMQTHSQIQRRAWCRKWIASCPKMVVYFSRGNYLQKITTLSVQDFVVNQVVSLLLLG